MIMQGDNLNVIMLSDLSASFKGILLYVIEVLCSSLPDPNTISFIQEKTFHFIYSVLNRFISFT